MCCRMQHYSCFFSNVTFLIFQIFKSKREQTEIYNMNSEAKKWVCMLQDAKISLTNEVTKWCLCLKKIMYFFNVRGHGSKIAQLSTLYLIQCSDALDRGFTPLFQDISILLATFHKISKKLIQSVQTSNQTRELIRKSYQW